jgi:predicted Zn-dependent protease
VDKAVKTSIAGTQWNASSWQASLEAQKTQLAYMKEPPMDLSPGEYRVYLAPAAVAEILSLMCWGGFSKRAKEEKRSPLQYLYEGKKALSPKVSLVENTQSGIGPFFNASGFDRPLQTQLVKDGSGQELLTSPRSAQKYKCDTNGADEDEGPLSLQMAPGGLSEKEVLETLGTGLYINNLWYLNFSDRIAGRITGMTRFGCFWVENGKIQRPINVLRFDDSIYDILGTHLEDLTRIAEVQISADTYGSRSVDCMENPGALVERMKFTL